MTTVGVIGLGRMGGRMAEHLLDEGFDVTGYDIQEESVNSLQKAGGNGVRNISKVVDNADILLTSLPGPDSVMDVFCGDDGILELGSEGLTVLDTTTSRPDTTRSIADVAEKEGIQLVDVPVSGGTSGAKNGTLTLMIGAHKGALGSDAQDVLDTIGEKRYYLESVGAGHTTKLVNNVLTAGHRALAMEAITLGVAHGVDPEMLYKVISNSSGSSNQFEKRVPRVLNRNFDPSFTVDLTTKDIALGLRTADEISYPMMITSLVHELHKEASTKGYGGEDACAVVKIFEENADVTVRTEHEVDESYEGY